MAPNPVVVAHISRFGGRILYTVGDISQCRGERFKRYTHNAGGCKGTRWWEILGNPKKVKRKVAVNTQSPNDERKRRERFCFNDEVQEVPPTRMMKLRLMMMKMKMMISQSMKKGSLHSDDQLKQQRNLQVP
jgi:hypothetical protein